MTTVSECAVIRALVPMNKGFDTVRYIVDAGRELIGSFASAGHATTPGLVGSAREAPTRRKLEQLLPSGIAVGSGCVIDSYGGTSRQIDIVLYEKHLCPVYSINDDAATTYYPCEGVIAVGEIKSCIASSDLEDIFTKIVSVKKLRRHAQKSSDTTSTELGFQASVPFRTYGSPNSMLGTKAEQFDQERNPLDQIFGFALAGFLELKPGTINEKYAQFSAKNGRLLSPNLIVTLDDNQVLSPLQIGPNGQSTQISISIQNANAICCVTRPEGGFQFLLSRIYTVYRRGRTVEEIALDRYFAKDGQLTLRLDGSIVHLT